MMLLKINYDKYFSGVDRIEPMRERDDLKRMVRDLMLVHISSTAQRHKFRTLKARSVSLDQYIQRNLVMIERGTHPKMRFRADLADKSRGQMQALLAQRQAERASRAGKEDAAYKKVFDSYMGAREKAGLNTDVSFDSVRDSLRRQVREVKSRYQCTSVVFRVVSEGGKVKLKAIPKKE
ncbi:MAG: MXAN_5187 C-terminal domain-containing protein [Myxococcota bacterium]|nr:MXAN_5187 C-terminal domain-containing protein [Myxococcota bacterium]